MASTVCEICKIDDSLHQMQRCFLCQRNMCFDCVTQDECIRRDLFDQMPFWACFNCRNERNGANNEAELEKCSKCSSYSCTKVDCSHSNEEIYSSDQRTETWVCHSCVNGGCNFPCKKLSVISGDEEVARGMDIVNFEKELNNDLDEIMYNFFGEALRIQDGEEWVKIESKEALNTIEEDPLGATIDALQSYIEKNKNKIDRQAVDNAAIEGKSLGSEASGYPKEGENLTDDELVTVVVDSSQAPRSSIEDKSEIISPDTEDGEKVEQPRVTDDEKVSNLYNEAAELLKFAPENERKFREAVLLKSLSRIDGCEERPKLTQNALKETGAVKRQLMRVEEANIFRSKAWSAQRNLDDAELDDVPMTTSPHSYTSEEVECGFDAETEELVPRKSDIEEAAMCEEASGYGHGAHSLPTPEFRRREEDKIEAAIDAIRTVGVIGRRMKKITIEGLKLCLEEKIECLLRIYEDLNKVD